MYTLYCSMICHFRIAVTESGGRIEEFEHHRSNSLTIGLPVYEAIYRCGHVRSSEGRSEFWKPYPFSSILSVNKSWVHPLFGNIQSKSVTKIFHLVWNRILVRSFRDGLLLIDIIIPNSVFLISHQWSRRIA